MPYDDSKDLLLKDLSKEFEAHEICIEYVVKLTSETETNLQKLNIIKKSKARVIIALGKFLLYYMSLGEVDVARQNITLIIDDSWLFGIFLDSKFLQVFNCSLMISPAENYIPGLRKFINSVNLKNHPDDPILQDIMYFYFTCVIPDRYKMSTFQNTYELSLHDCARKEYPITAKFVNLNYSTYFSVHASVYLLALAVKYTQEYPIKTSAKSKILHYKNKVSRQ